MKKVYIILVVIISFSLGFFVSKISRVKPLENPVQNSITVRQKNELQSGVYEDLYFKNLRKDGNNYFISFSKQMENKKYPAKCYLIDGTIRLDNEEIDGCYMQGRSLQEKINPDLDLSKEYKFDPKAVVQLIHYDNGIGNSNWPLAVSTFYEYIYKLQKPVMEYYGLVIEQPTDWGFKVIMVNDQIVYISQIYQE